MPFGYRTIGGWAKHRPSVDRREVSLCEGCGRPLLGRSRYAKTCDRCRLERMKQGAGGRDVAR